MKLGVNIDHVATVRQARMTVEPDPVAAAFRAELGGADGIVCHLREDRRHIQDRDLAILRQVVTSHLNLEMAATEEMIGVALGIAPETCTLVPERRQEVTTEGGLDVAGQAGALGEAVERLRKAGRRVSLFIDPEPRQVKASAKAGARAVEIHTGQYADARDGAGRQRELARIIEAARLARAEGLEVAAGHGLTYRNVGPVAAVPEIEELNIGHSIISRAIFTGLESAVREMVLVIGRARRGVHE